VAEAGVTLATLRVEDAEGRPTPRRPVAIPRDQRLRSLPDDIASKPDPRAPGELEAEPGRFGDGGGQAATEARRFEHDEERLRAPGECGQPAEPVGDPGRAIRGGQPATGQIEDEQVDQAPGQQGATDREPLIEGLRGDDDEPLQVDAAGDGLDRVEAAREVEPGDDGALGLGFRREPQDERRPAARAVAADRDTRRTRQATRSQDGVERREPGVDDAVVRVGAGLVPWPDVGEWHQGRFGRQRKRPDDPRSCGTPAGPEARDSGVHFGARGRHRMPRLEHLFYSDKALVPIPHPRHRAVTRDA
jgi:hypothetical protein